MNKKNIKLFVIAGVLIALAGFITFGNNETLAKVLSFFVSAPKITDNSIILFYGTGCPHCEIVEDYIKENNIEEKVLFSRLEVFNNESNAKILLEKAQICKLDTTSVGVPFLWDGQNCLMGDQDVINFFKERAGILN